LDGRHCGRWSEEAFSISEWSPWPENPASGKLIQDEMLAGEISSSHASFATPESISPRTEGHLEVQPDLLSGKPAKLQGFVGCSSSVPQWLLQ
jgi:hypothetical protein